MRGEREDLGELDIGDKNYALELLKRAHGEDPRRPIKELVENSIDANAVNILIGIGRNEIAVDDDGHGMSREKLRELPKSIAKSEKRLRKELQERTKGIHGIGLLSTLLLGEKVEIVSKCENCEQAYKLTIYGNYKATLEPVNRERKGTMVRIHGKNLTRKFKVLTLQKIKEYIGREFLLDILRGGVRIRIRKVEKGEIKEETIDCASIQSASYYLIDENIPTDFGNIEVKIQYKSFLEKVSIYRHGGLIKEDICLLKDVELSDCWRQREVGGFITADFLDVTTDKRDFIRNEKYYEFIAKIKLIEKKLEERLRELEEKRDEEQRRKFVEELNKKFMRKLSEMRWNFPNTIVRTLKGDKIGKEVAGIGHKGVGKKRTKPTGKKTISEGEGDKQGTSGKGISILFERFPPEEMFLRSKYNEQLGVILINESHDDYIKRFKEGDDAQKIDYLYKLVAKELTLWNWEEVDKREILEKLLDLQFSMEEKPPRII